MKYFIFFCLFLSANLIFALDTIVVKSKITAVTVFFSGAQIERDAAIKASKGKHLFIFDELPAEVNPLSIQVQSISGTKTLSVKHQIIYPAGNKTKEHRILEEDVDAIELKIKELKNKNNVYEMEERMLMGNSDLGGKEGAASIAEIKLAADYYRQRLTEIRQAQLLISEQINALIKETKEVYEKINRATSRKRLPYSQIQVALELEKELAGNLKVTYNLSSAGWVPAYDFRVEEITRPLTIIYNANVYQSTGELWNNVKLTLSTGNPSLSGTKPELARWILGRPGQSNTDQPIGSGAIRGRIFDKQSSEPLPFVNIELKKDNQVVTAGSTDINGQYSFKPVEAGYYLMTITYIGYEQASFNVVVNDKLVTTKDAALIPAALELQSVVVEKSSTSAMVTRSDIQKMPGRSAESVKRKSLRGSRSDGSDTYVDGLIADDSFMESPAQAEIRNLEYEIEIPYSIPSDGEDYSIQIKEATVPVKYTFVTVPKLDDDVFLTAGIPQWTRLDLLPGKANIFYQGTYTGESEVGTETVSDTLMVSLGRDKNIVVERTGNKELSNRSIIGGNIKQTVAWDIVVKNNKTAVVNIVVEDQYPVSEHKAVEVEILETSGAKVDEKTGMLTWEITLGPGEKKAMKNYYSVRFPKEMYLVVD